MLRYLSTISLTLAICFFVPAGLVCAMTSDEYFGYSAATGPATTTTTSALAVVEASNEIRSSLISKPGESTTFAGFFDDSVSFMIPTDKILGSGLNMEVTKVNEPMPMPWKLDLVSPIYQYDIKDKSSLATGTVLDIFLSYSTTTNKYKQIYFFDRTKQSWRPLNGLDDPYSSRAAASSSLTFARIAVFSNPSVMNRGLATWYAYKNGDFAASPDFPKGSKLLVTNLDNKKSLIVTVNDFGPDRKLFPKYVIDLDKVAFKKIANLRAGVFNVHVQPIYVPKDKYGKVLGIKIGGADSELGNLSSKAALVFDENKNKIIWSKNQDSIMPLASLTKLVAVKVFMDTRPTLDQVVAYSKKDEGYNKLYAALGSTARLRVNDGETMKVEDLVYSALVGSANNAVESMVRLSGYSRDQFIDKMNQLVKLWGAENTSFVEPSGLSPYNVTTPSDYAVIAKKALSHPIIEKASKSRVYKFKTVNTKKPHTIWNTSQLVLDGKYDMAGSKTGYIDESGYCLMSRVKGDKGNNLIVVTMGAKDRNGSFADNEELIDYGLRQLTKL